MAYRPLSVSSPTLDPRDTSRLYAAARALAGALSADEVAASVLDHALVDFGASTAGLWLIEAGNIRFVGGAGHSRGAPEAVGPIPLDSVLPAAEALRSGDIVVFGSREERDRRWPSLARLGAQAQAIAVLPLVARGRAIGCLHIGYPVTLAPSEFDRPFLSSLAELVAAALDRTQLYDAERDRQAFLLDAWRAVTNAESYADTLRRLAAIAVPRLADLCLIDVKEITGDVRRLAAVHADPDKAALTAELAEKYSPVPGGPHPASGAVAWGRSYWSATMTDEFLRHTSQDERHFEIVKELGFTSYMCVPLIAGEDPLGAITLVSAGSGRRFGGSDLALAEELASRVANVVAGARRHDREQQLAHELQRLLLPERLPRRPDLDVAVRYLTAEAGAEAGGDFYDVVNLPSGGVGFLIGDVEGHDTMAAATMGQLRSAARALAGQVRQPAQLVDVLRSSWELLGFRRTATGVFGRIDPTTGDVVLASAGHLPPVIIDSCGQASVLPVEPSPPLGVSAGPAAEYRFHMGRQDTLFLYTDGLVEERHGSLDDALQRLRGLLEDVPRASLDALCEKILVAHDPGGARHDDAAILAIRRT
jgi:serine/threonine-protein kinase RsbW